MSSRREFLKSSSIMTVGGLVAASQLSSAQLATLPPPKTPTPPHTPPQSPVNPGLYHGAGTLRASAFANLWRGNATPQDFHTAATALSGVHANWVGARLDQRLIPGYNTVTERDLVPSRMPLSTITAHIARYNPGVTLAKVTKSMHYLLDNTVANGVDYKTLTLQKMRHGGMSTLIGQGVQVLNTIALHVPAIKVNPVTHTYVPQVRPPNGPPIGGGGGGNNTCGYMEAAAVGLGIASVVIAVMTGGLGLLAEAGAWEAISFWAGVDAVGIDVEHALIC